MMIIWRTVKWSVLLLILASHVSQGHEDGDDPDHTHGKSNVETFDSLSRGRRTATSSSHNWSKVFSKGRDFSPWRRRIISFSACLRGLIVPTKVGCGGISRQWQGRRHLHPDVRDLFRLRSRLLPERWHWPVSMVAQTIPTLVDGSLFGPWQQSRPCVAQSRQVMPVRCFGWGMAAGWHRSIYPHRSGSSSQWQWWSFSKGRPRSRRLSII